MGILFSLGPVVGSGNLGSAVASVVAAEEGFIVLCHVDLRRRRMQGEAVVITSMSFMCNGGPAMLCARAHRRQDVHFKVCGCISLSALIEVMWSCLPL